MKRLLCLLAFAGILMGCTAGMEEEVQDLKNRVAALENTKISTIQDQISAITKAIETLSNAQSSLKDKDEELADLIESLQAYADATDDEFASIRESIKSLTSAQESLKGKDGELTSLIEQLKTYVDDSLSAEKDWVKASYCTLEQYQAMADEVASLKETIQGTYCTLDQFQTLVDEMASLKESIEGNYATLEQFQTLSDEVAALKEQFNASGAEYDEKLAALDSAIKSWVSEALSGYYDIATMDAKLEALATKEGVQQELDAMQEEIDDARSEIADAKDELTSAYKKAIADAINSNNGVIDVKIATEIGKVIAYVQHEVEYLQDLIDILEDRITDLEKAVAGLKVSDSVFGFVLYTQKDTITKGLKFPITFRVNPSGVPFTQDMVILDNMATVKYLLEEDQDTKASYITESMNFYVDSLGKTRNAANEEMDGQYFIRVGTKDNRNMIDDSVFSLVGAYRDKQNVIQYVSTNPFQLVMMPTPEEGLSPWLYAHGNVMRKVQVNVPAVPAEGNNPGQEAYTYMKDELGCITFSLDSHRYKQENGSAKQVYSTRKYIRSLNFEGDTKADSIVFMQPVKDSGFVRFIPDTSKTEWAALLNSTKPAMLKVKGKIHAADRFGGFSSFPVEMTWYARCNDTIDVVKKVSDFYEADGVTKKAIFLDLEQEFKNMGYDVAQLNAVPRKALEKTLSTGNSGGRIGFRFALESEAEEDKQPVTVRINGIVGKSSLPGTYNMPVMNTVLSIPCESDPDKKEEQITATAVIRLTINPD